MPVDTVILSYTDSKRRSLIVPIPVTSAEETTMFGEPLNPVASPVKFPLNVVAVATHVTLIPPGNPTAPTPSFALILFTLIWDIAFGLSF